MTIHADTDYASAVPKYTFADVPADQEEQLASNPMLLCFAESRRTFASDLYRSAYH